MSSVHVYLLLDCMPILGTAFAMVLLAFTIVKGSNEREADFERTLRVKL